jgi:hypothetical protein
VLGFAKLLPQIVPVKRETLQVVSLAMTGLMRGWGRVFHIVENKGRLRFVELGQEILFWDRMSRQGLGLPWSIKDVSVVPPGRILMACPTQRLKRWATFVGPSGTLSHTVQEHPVLLFLDPRPRPLGPDRDRCGAYKCSHEAHTRRGDTAVATGLWESAAAIASGFF